MIPERAQKFCPVEYLFTPELSLRRAIATSFVFVESAVRKCKRKCKRPVGEFIV